MTTKVTPELCNHMRPHIETALADLAKQHGLQVRTGRATYSDAQVTFKVEFRLEGHDPDAEGFALYASMFGLKPEDRGREFATPEGRYKLVGLKPSRPKYPIVAEKLDNPNKGKRYKMTEAAIRSLKGVRHDQRKAG